MISFADGGAIYLCRMPQIVDGKTSLAELICEKPQAWSLHLYTIKEVVRGLRVSKNEEDPRDGRSSSYVVYYAKSDCTTFMWLIS